MGNLLSLFSSEKQELESWIKSSNRERRFNYSPKAVRDKLSTEDSGPPIDEKRYWKLCEVGVHPVPNQVPSHFTGTGRAAIGPVFQQVGVNVCFTELAIAVSVCGIGVISLFPHDKVTNQVLVDRSWGLANSIGNFSILNYEELLQEVYDDQNA